MRFAGVLLALLLAVPLAAQAPRLVVVVSVDQLRFDYVDRFAPWFTTDGFRRFTTEGATFPNARYRYAVAFTGPGHASIGTGSVPAQSGIVGNNWFDRAAPVDVSTWRWYFDDITAWLPPNVKAAPFTAEGPAWWKLGGSPRYCTYDSAVQVTAGETSGMSPVSLERDAIGDRLKAKNIDSRVISVGYKDRAAILMAGREADAVYWFDYELPGFVSSTYYRFNRDVLRFNALIPGYIPGSAQWTPSPFIPSDQLREVTFDPPEAWPLKNTRYEGTFPHPVTSVRGLTYSPFAHDMLLDFAHHVINVESLGADAAPDLLFVAISSTDYLGHYYGPDSMEVADSMVRLDRSLAHFLALLERRFGEDVLVVLTSDHGVQANPEIVKLRDPSADVGRLDVRTPDPGARSIADLPPTRITIERELARRLGVAFSEAAPLQDAFVYFFEEPGFWINWKRVAELGLDRERVKNELRDLIRSMKSSGVADAWTNSDLTRPGDGVLFNLMRASFRADRSPDVLIALRPGWMWSWGSNSTTHGQPVENDLRVPLMFWGAAVRPGRYEMDASPLDIARTLGALLGVEAGGEGSMLLPALQQQRD